MGAGNLVIRIGSVLSINASICGKAQRCREHLPSWKHRREDRHYQKQSLTVAGKSIGLIHANQPPEAEREYLRPDYDYDSPPVGALYQFLFNELPEAEIIIFGHLHVPLVKRENDRLLINPGSVAPYKGHCSFGILLLDASGADVEIIEL